MADTTTDTITGTPSLGDVARTAYEPFLRAADGLPASVVDGAFVARVCADAAHPGSVVILKGGDFRALASAIRAAPPPEALAQALAAARAETDWRDISTAPRDRTRVLVAVPSLHVGEPMVVGEAYFDPAHDGGAWWWSGTGPKDYFTSPIHEMNAGPPTRWMPLPAPPTPAQTDTTPGGRA